MQARRLRRRFWLDVGAALAAMLVLAVTAVQPMWVESVLGLDPDAGSGAVEWLYAGLVAGVAAGSSLLARAELRRGPDRSGAVRHS